MPWSSRRRTRGRSRPTAGLAPHAPRPWQPESLERRVLLAAADPADPAAFAPMTPDLVADLSTATAHSFPGRAIAVGDTFYFTANDGVHGLELWRTGTTPGTTALVKDLNPGREGSNFSALHRVGDAIYFTADQTLYRSDGTPEGTVPLARVFLLGKVADVNGTAFFGAASDEPGAAGTGVELWKSDGTAAGTGMVKNIYPDSAAGPGSSVPGDITGLGGLAYFFAVSPDVGMELWKSDGTEAGTSLVKDINPGPAGSNSQAPFPPAYMKAFGGALYFAADGPTGRQLYKSDGTEAGTAPLTPAPGPGTPAELTVSNGRLFFSARDSSAGRELWRTDGTAEGTVRLTDVVPGPGNSTPSSLVDANGTLFFAAGPTSGGRLWTSDGTAAGTAAVPSTAAVGLRSPNDDFSAWQIVATAPGERSVFFYSPNDGLWRSDGTAAGTVPVRQTVARPGAPRQVTVGTELVLVGAGAGPGRALFGGHTLALGQEPYLADAASATASLAADVNRTTVSTQFFETFARSDGTLLFSARVADQWGVWRSDGTAAGTTLLRQTTLAASDFTEAGGTVYFVARDADNSSEVWKTDGTPSGTAVVKDIHGGGDTAWPRGLTAFQGRLYFWARGRGDGYELWKSDGTDAGTVRVKDIRQGPGDALASDQTGSPVTTLTEFNGLLYFSANDGLRSPRARLWRTDGTEAGTVMVTDPDDPHAPSSPAELTVSGGRLYFQAHSTLPVGTGGRPSYHELWATDGTSAGTRLVIDMSPAGFSENRLLTDVAGTLYFASAQDSSGNWAVYRTDGTAAGTAKVTDGNPRWLAAVDGSLFFPLAAAASGDELWKTDPSRAGATPVKDINPGPAGSDPGPPAAFGRYLYFTAYEASAGYSLWRSDGTAEGTALVADPAPGPATTSAADVGHAVVAGGTLFLVGATAQYGTELLKLPAAPLPAHGVVARRVVRPDAGNVTDAAASALLPGGAASALHVSTSAHGIPGILVDLTGVPAGAAPTASDVALHMLVGGEWVAARPPAAFEFNRAGGTAGSDRIVMTLAPGAVRNGWLRVTVAAGDRTGLASPDVFYFGHLAGDTGGPGTPRVDVMDLARTRANLGRTTAAALNTFDFNRDGRINALDVGIVRSNQRRSLPLFTAPAAPLAAAAARGSGALAPAAQLAPPPVRRSAWELIDSE